jgi:hypothetical protein
MGNYFKSFTSQRSREKIYNYRVSEVNSPRKGKWEHLTSFSGFCKDRGGKEVQVLKARRSMPKI